MTPVLRSVCIGTLVGFLLFGAGCMQLVETPPANQARAVILPPARPTIDPADAINDAARSLARQIVAGTPAASRVRRIAILPLTDTTGRAGALAGTLRDALRTEIFRLGNYEIVADNDMDRALRQINIDLKLEKRDYIDRSTFRKMGALLSADALVDGRITDSVTQLRVSLEMISIETGQLANVAQHMLPLYVLGSGGGGGGASQSAFSTLYVGADWLETRLDSVVRGRDNVIRARFVFLNRSERPVRLYLSDPARKTYLTDDHGNAYNFRGAEGLDSSGAALIRQGTTQTVVLYFAAPASPEQLLTLRTAWTASGTAAHGKEFVVPSVRAVQASN